MDRDSLGKVRVPSGAYYGAFTARAVRQYRVTGTGAHPNLVRAFAMIKRSAAVANVKVGALDARRGRAIVAACDRILAGRHADQFVVDMINSGAGTAFNMNTNEVIANVALEILRKKKGQYDLLHPNDHVNMSQSSNDTYPTAMHLSVLMSLEDAVPAMDALVGSLSAKAREFAPFRKIGRTHLMDALPVTLGSEFGAYATSVKRARDRVVASRRGLQRVALGGGRPWALAPTRRGGTGRQP